MIVIFYANFYHHTLWGVVAFKIFFKYNNIGILEIYYYFSDTVKFVRGFSLTSDSDLDRSRRLLQTASMESLILETRHLKELLLVNLDLVQNQQELLAEKERQLNQLQQENETVCQYYMFCIPYRD